MVEYPLSYREVISDQSVPDSIKEISLNTGGTQSILQDIKLVDKANGFSYRDSSKHYTRNRFIYWRICNDTLELVEHSLDVNLSGNRIKFRFVDAQILDGISVHETTDNVIVLVPTVCSVHKLVFPHPRRFHRADELLGIHTNISAPSIFAETNDTEVRKSSLFYLFSGPNSQLPYLASSILSVDLEDGIFVFVYPSGEILLVKLGGDGHNYSVELKNESLVPRFLSGLADKLRSKTNDPDAIVSLVLHSVGLETFAITLTRDAKLQFWSCTTTHCTTVFNVLSETGDYSSISSQGAQNNVLRKAVNGDEEQCRLAVFLSNQNLFHILKPIFEAGQVKVTRLHSLYAPENDLIDVSLTVSRIWSIWRNEAGECKVFSACLEKSENQVVDWIPVILEDPSESQPPLLDTEADPSQVYLQYIFQPGRFPLHVINKAINTYRRSTILADVPISPASMKRIVSKAVHNEVLKELKENEVGHDEYLQCACWCWERFYSCCLQYHVAGLKPLGILLLPSVSGAVLLKKSTFSFLRPLDTLEYMLLCSGNMTQCQFLQQAGLSEDPDVIQDVITLMEVIVHLNNQMGDVFAYTFEQELQQLRLPDVMMAELLDNIDIEMDTEFTEKIFEMLGQCRDLYKAVHKILELVRDAHRYDDDEGKGCSNTLAYLFSSQLGVSIVSHSLHQQTRVRFTICRNLLLCCNILLSKQKLSEDVLEAIRSVCMPEIVVLTQASYVIYWMSDLPALPVLSHETLHRSLAPLKLSPVFNLNGKNGQIMSVLASFISSTGGQVGHKKFNRVKEFGDVQHWHNSLLPYLSHLFHIIWPVSGCPILAEWLLSSGQHVWLQQYVRLLKNWCEWNNCTRSFLLACSYLLTSDNYKARKLFEAAAKGIFTDSFLMQKILKDNAEEDRSKAYVTYYLKVIQLFELNNVDDFAIQVAETALREVTPHGPLASMLYSIKFKHHLKLKHYSEAYDALNSNPDDERKRDNLRDLVKSLLDAKELVILMTFIYGDLEDLFLEILLSRARAVDVVDNVFYDFLYSYHIKRGNPYFFKAGALMYEQAYRLSCNKNIEALVKQVKCYLAALNILRVCNDEDAQIPRPKDTEGVLLPTQQELIPASTKVNQIEFVTIKDIKREYEFACAKLKFASYCPETFNNFSVSTPDELLMALMSCGLYQVALKLCKSLNMSYVTIFDHLTSQCVLLTENQHRGGQNWNWLVRNETQDLVITHNNPVDVAWLFLEQLVNQYEEPGLTTIHKVVCSRIIRMGAFIPYWLLSSYKLRNPAELLRLFHSTGRLLEAIDIASKYLLAIMGHGKEYYGLNTAICPTGPVVYSPVNSINNLIIELKIQIQKGHKRFIKDHDLLQDLFNKYIANAVRISNDMCKFRYSVYNNPQIKQNYIRT